MYKLSVFIPQSHLEVVKTALFQAGAGTIGPYDCCSWQTLGTGQYRPLADSQPYLGQIGEIETITEYKLELVVEDELIKHVITALRQAHPYEMPAYDVWQLADI